MKPAIDIKALKASLRKALFDYRKERPHLSLRAIAKNSGCNRYFLSKLTDESDFSNSIDLHQVLIFVQFVTGRSCIREAVEASEPVVREAFSKIVSPEFIQTREVSLKMSQVNLYDTYNYFVLVLASYGQGTKRELVRKILGYRGEQVLKKFLKEDLVVEREGRIHLKEGNEFTLSYDVYRERIPDYLKYYSSERNFQNKNFIHVYSEGLTEDACKKIYKLHQKLKSDIETIVLDKKNHGDIPFFTFGCMDRLYDIDEERELDEESLVSATCESEEGLTEQATSQEAAAL